jgi:pimeloyl-ACP methyl ester carboxylesterase
MVNKNTTPLVLLHGALGNKQQFDNILPELKQHFDVYRLDFEGHGESGATDSPFRIDYFAENVLGLLDVHEIGKANFFGYSMGGYVALSLAKENPDRVHKIATLGTILRWDKEIAKRECGYLNPPKMKEKVPHFVEQLNERHSSGWERVVDHTREMLQHLGHNPVIKDQDWNRIDQPVRFHAGDRDTTINMEETIDIYKKMDDAELCVLPGTGHPIEGANTSVLVASLIEFFLR